MIARNSGDTTLNSLSHSTDRIEQSVRRGLRFGNTEISVVSRIRYTPPPTTAGLVWEPVIRGHHTQFAVKYGTGLQRRVFRTRMATGPGQIGHPDGGAGGASSGNEEAQNLCRGGSDDVQEVALFALSLCGSHGRIPLPGRWSTGPSTRSEIEKAWGVSAEP